MKFLEGISKKSRIALFVAGFIMLTFFLLQSCVSFGFCEATYEIALVGYVCVIAFMPPFFMVVFEFISLKDRISKQLDRKIEELKTFENFVQEAVLVSKADANRKITYVNKKFEDVSKWKSEDVIGKDHVVVNSNTQPVGYWGEMYNVVNNGGIWNDIVTNKAKDGSIYHVDTYIKANFNHKGEITGYTSIRQDISEIVKGKEEIEKKNTYLEHAAKILRHDMHSGINTYIPRGITSLERRVTEEQIKDLKIEAPLKMIKEGLRHTQKVYKGVYEFTNLVKKDVLLEKTNCNLKDILEDYLSSTAYKSQVLIEDLGELEVNESLFCTSIDNLIRNGLKYNDNDSKKVKIYRIDDVIFVEDNGRGLSQSDFDNLSKPYTRKEGQKESGTGLGLNICIAILKEHGFGIKCDKLPEGGTKIKIKITNE